MNADQATCGYGCSGNPYDAYWAFSPLGHGDLHELGHGLEKGRFRFAGWEGIRRPTTTPTTASLVSSKIRVRNQPAKAWISKVSLNCCKPVEHKAIQMLIWRSKTKRVGAGVLAFTFK